MNNKDVYEILTNMIGRTRYIKIKYKSLINNKL